MEIRLGAPWLRWLYWLAVVLVAAGITVLVTARTAEVSYGTAVITEPGGRFAALLPVAVVPELEHAAGVSMLLEAGRSRPVRITRARLRLAAPGTVRQAGLAQPAQPSVLLTGRLAAGTMAWPAGRSRRLVTSLRLVLRPEPVRTILSREFEVMIGTRQAGS